MSGVEGFVYVISNKSMPDYVKIGYTTRDPERRASELSGTALPFPSVVEFYVRVPNAVLVERQTHQRLHAVRVSRDREWFACSRVAAIEAIKASAGSLIQAEKDRVLEEERRRTRKERERQEAELRRRQEEAARDKAEAKQRAIQEVDKKIRSAPRFLNTGSSFRYLLGDRKHPRRSLFKHLFVKRQGAFWWL
jgi:hypothetical protein